MSFGRFAFGGAAFGATTSGIGARGNATFAALEAFGSAEAPTPISGAVGTATFAALTADATAIAPPRGIGFATFAQLEAQIRLRAESRRTVRSWQQCPRPASGFTICGPVGSLRDGPQQ